MFPKERISNCFSDWAESLYSHECPSKFSPLEIFLHTGYECKECRTQFLISSGLLFQTMPSALRWHMHSHEGRLLFLEKVKTGELLGVAPFFLPEPK